MKVTAAAVSLTVDDPAASSRFLREHLGFEERAGADGFASLGRADTPTTVIFLRRGIEVLPEGFRDERAAGVILALTVENLEAEHARLVKAGVPIAMALREEPWGERLFQVRDPNGVTVQLVEWVGEPAS